MISNRRRGLMTLVALLCLVVVVATCGQVMRTMLLSHQQLRVRQDVRQAAQLAVAAEQLARVRWQADAAYAGETWRPVLATPRGEQTGVVTIHVTPGPADAPEQVRLAIEVVWPEQPPRRVRRQLAVLVNKNLTGDRP